MKNADLHTHSYYSDGELSPKQLVRLAKKRGIKHLALTDHNSVKGIKEAVKEGKKIGVDVIPALELRINTGEVLAYFIDIDNRDLIKKLNKDNKKTQEEIKEWCRRLNKKGYKLSYKSLEKRYPKAKGNYNNFHVMQSLSENGYGTIPELRKKLRNPLLAKKKHAGKITFLQGIKLIKKGGGVPVLAHPWLGNPEKNFKNMKSLVKAGLKGLEINNGDNLKFMRMTSKKRNITKDIKNAAKRYNLLLTRGTDFHGDNTAKFMAGNHVLGKNKCNESVVKKLKALAKNS